MYIHNSDEQLQAKLKHIEDNETSHKARRKAMRVVVVKRMDSMIGQRMFKIEDGKITNLYYEGTLYDDTQLFLDNNVYVEHCIMSLAYEVDGVSTRMTRKGAMMEAREQLANMLDRLDARIAKRYM